ncbi:MAG: 16S rRNA (cytosine(1402)-N(4))-methyltransferase, partial [Chloroflexi bacterium RBG_16_56_8]
MSQQPAHIPVLFQSVIEFLAPQPGGRYIDGTLGAGGHVAGILDASAPTGRVLGLDADPQALAVAATNLVRYGKRVTMQHSNFANLKQVAAEQGFVPANGILLDLGLS